MKSPLATVLACALLAPSLATAEGPCARSAL
jgi:hypothetical protein